MATVGGIGGGLLMCTVLGIVLWGNPSRENAEFASLIVLLIVATFLCAFPGNMIATWPYRVELEPQKGIRLFAPFKSVYIPLVELRQVRRTVWMQVFQQGIVVTLCRRHGLLKAFVIHWGFGEEGRQLAQVLQDYLADRT